MSKRISSLFIIAVLTAILSSIGIGQTTGSILGIVTDEQGAVIPGATVTIRNTDTNSLRTAVTSENGRYRITNLPVGNYEVTVQAGGFAKYQQTGITLLLNQDAVIDAIMKAGQVVEVVTVTENASQLNTVNAEVSNRYDSKRISDLPLAANGNIFNIAASAAGVSTLGSGQNTFAGGMNFSVNGARLRSNNFTIDGQDINDPSVTGAQQPINNPDLVQEVRLITNQYAAEYGRNSGSIFAVVTKSGGNQYHGSAAWFHNGNALNSKTNLENKLTKSPFRVENRYSATVGGPIRLPMYNGRDKTFFFTSLQRWSDRQFNAGTALTGAPTEAGRQVLQSIVGNRPQVAVLLKYVPAAQTPSGTSAKFKVGGVEYAVPLGSMVSASSITFDNWQGSTRVDHNLTSNNLIGVRYMINDQLNAGGGQTSPPGLTTVVPSRSQAASTWLNSSLSSRWFNEVRLSWSRFGSVSNAFDPSSLEIPSIEITELSMAGFNAGPSRTAFGLALNLPQFRFNNTYQIQDTVSYTTGSHTVKFGADIRRTQIKSFFLPTIRGRLEYTSLDNFVNDISQIAAINSPLKGGSEIQYYDNYDHFFFAQDEWKVSRSFSLTFGLRYELYGNTIDDLIPINDKIVSAAGGNEAFRFTGVPPSDTNNFQPRFGFSWNPRTERSIFRFITGGNKLVLRGGAARTNDASFVNINLNIASSFPFVGVFNIPTPTVGSIPNAFTEVNKIRNGIIPPVNPKTQTRTIVEERFRTPLYDQFSLEVQRELSNNFVMKVGYIGTRGTGLFQSLDGNPMLPNPDPTKVSTTRVNPDLGPIRLRANAASSIYHSLQTSLDKRLSRNFSAGFHYTYSSAIDTASEIFNTSLTDVALSQNSFNRRAERARSAYDRPHRFSGNFVYEIPYFRQQNGLFGKILGGWQLNSLFTFQDGAPFTIINGSDPTGALNGISGLVGNSIRPDLNTNLDLSSMTIREILAAGGASLFSPLVKGDGRRTGNAGRNILRADGIGNIDFGFQKNTKIAEGKFLQFRADMFNATNTRNFGIPGANAAAASGFLDEGSTLGGNRRIVLGLRFTF